ncbi:MAG TPA: 50S ribosomal protein L4 [Clostridiales bacterium]|nr:50S ribosomal protein L4 [Clostridiales bacterium]
MPKVDVYNMKGEIVGQMDLSEKVFGVELNDNAVQIAIVNQLANQRQGTQSTKTRSEVSGGGRKPYRQKGTGRARQGSTRAPQWTKGGVALGPKPRSYRYEIPKKVKRIALKSALSSKVQENDILVLDTIAFDTVKTKQMVSFLSALKVDSSALVVLEAPNRNVGLSARNIPGIKTALVNTINTFDILKHRKFIITRDAVSKVEEVYAG